MDTGGTVQPTTADLGREISMEEINRQALAVGERAFAVIQAFLARQLTLDELTTRLRETEASDYLAYHWKALTRRPEAAPALEVLQLIAFLPDQAGYQVARYGASSIADDRDQLVSALRRIARGGETHKVGGGAFRLSLNRK